MVTDPIGYLNAVGTVIAHLDDLDQIIAQIPKSIQAQQELNNPHDKGTDAYAAFRQGWYEGYITYMVLESAVPVSKVGQAAKNSKRLQKAVNALDRTGHLRAAAKYTAQTVDTAKAPARYAGTQLTRGLAASKSFGKDVGRGLLDGAKTVGQKVRWGRHADELSPESARLVADGGVDFRRAVYRAADSDAIDSYAQLDRAVRTIDDLDGVRKERAKALVDEAGGDGLKFVDELEPTTLGKVLDSSEVHVDELARASRHYTDLDSAKRSQFREILADDDLRDSWVQVAGKSGVTSADIRAALNNVDRIDGYGTVDRFYTGKKIQQQEYPPSWDDVYPANSIVTEYTLTKRTEFYRLYTQGGSNQAGRFLLRSEDDIRTMSPSELQGQYAIPGDPPNTVARADIPAGTTMRSGKVAANDFGTGGGRQYILPESKVPDSEFDKGWFEKSDTLTAELNG